MALKPESESLALILIDGATKTRKNADELYHEALHLARHYPRRLVEQACQRALAEGIHSYKRIKALTEQLTAQALEQLNTPAQTKPALTQQHPLIRDGLKNILYYAATVIPAACARRAGCTIISTRWSSDTSACISRSSEIFWSL